MEVLDVLQGRCFQNCFQFAPRSDSYLNFEASKTEIREDNTIADHVG